jgi:hypothetical protein
MPSEQPQIDDGGAAFPVHPESHDRSDAEYSVLSGMSLRDYFAGQALIAVLHSGYNYDKCTQHCYQIADAMLKARRS